VVEHFGLFLGQNDNSTSAVGKSFKHDCSLSTVQVSCRYIEGNERVRQLMPLFAVGVTDVGGCRGWRSRRATGSARPAWKEDELIIPSSDTSVKAFVVG
jgi:hypothetical protein